MDSTAQSSDDTNTTTPVNTVSAGYKEAEPATVSREQIGEETSEYVIPQELAPHIEKPNEQVDIPPDLAQIGITVSPKDQPVVSQPTMAQTIHLPLTDDQIGVGLSAKSESSFRFLAVWCIKQLKRARIHLKKIHGHFFEVKDSK